jgi:hypothetical protein
MNSRMNESRSSRFRVARTGVSFVLAGCLAGQMLAGIWSPVATFAYVSQYETAAESRAAKSFGDSETSARPNAGESSGSSCQNSIAHDSEGDDATRRAVPELRRGTSTGVESDLSTLIGGSGSDRVFDVAIGPDGCIYVAGTTQSADFPTTPGAHSSTIHANTSDGFVAKLDPTGTDILFATFVGGSDYDEIVAIAVDEDGATYLTGRTSSPDFPGLVLGFRSVLLGPLDGFVARLDPTGANVTYASLIGGDDDTDYMTDIAVDANGNAYVVGNGKYSGFTSTPNALQPTPAGYGPMIVKVDTSRRGLESLGYASAFRGGSVEQPRSVVVDDAGRITVVGAAFSNDLPVTPGCFQPFRKGNDDGFVLTLDTSIPGPAGIVYLSYIGGEREDDLYAVALHDGLIYVAGTTNSTLFPTTDSGFQRALTPGILFTFETCVAVIDPAVAGSAALVYGTFFGSFGNEAPTDLAIDQAGNVWIGGYTGSPDLPTTPGAASGDQPGQDGFVAGFSPRLSGTASLLYSTYVGGAETDTVDAVAFDGNAGLVVAGFTLSPDFPVTAGIDPAPSDAVNGFLGTYRLPVSDVSVGQFVLDPSPVPRGGMAQLALTVANAGPASPTATSLTVFTPAGVSVDAVRRGDGSIVETLTGRHGERIVLLGNLAPASSVALTATLSIGAEVSGVFEVSAGIRSEVVDTHPSDNDGAVSTTAVTFPEFRKAKASSPPGAALSVNIRGGGFQPGAAVFLGGSATSWPSLRVANAGKIVLKGSGLGREFPVGTPVSILIVNPDGGFVVGTFQRR